MKIWPHGSNVNFQVSSREMTFTDIQSLFETYFSQSSLLVGMIDPDKQKIGSYGLLSDWNLEEEQLRLSLDDGESVTLPLHHLTISHEAIFDVLDEKEDPLQLKVLYLSLYDSASEQENIYFFISEQQIAHPLAYGAQFWEQVKEIGRDMDLSGCTVPRFLER